MKFLLRAFLTLAISTSIAFAACPPGMPYNCVPTMGGKMSCGCGR